MCKMFNQHKFETLNAFFPPSSIPEQRIPPMRLEALRAHHGGISISNAIHNAVDLRRFVSFSFVPNPVRQWTFRRTLKSTPVVERAHLQFSNWLARQTRPFFMVAIHLHLVSIHFHRAASSYLLLATCSRRRGRC